MKVDRFGAESGRRGQLRQGAGQLRHRAAEPLGKDLRHGLRQLDIPQRRQLPQNGQAGRRAGRGQRDRQSGRQPALQHRQQPGQLGRSRGSRHHHPPLLGQQGVQRVNELLLGAQFVRLPRGQQSKVFKNQQVGGAILGAELLDRLALDGVGQFAGELHRGGANHAMTAIVGLPHGGQAAGDVRLPRAAGTIQHQRVVAGVRPVVA